MPDQHTDNLGNVPNSSETFGKLPHDSERFGSVPNLSTRQENHILTVRQVARMFEEAGVARTERSITNWCKRDASGVSRLDAYLDMNEHKYFVTAESVERAIAEEKAKANTDGFPNASESTPPPMASVPNASEEVRHTAGRGGELGHDETLVKELEKQIMDLKILNGAKDFFIQQLQNDRVRLADDQKDLINKLVDHSHRIGQLETRLTIEAPKQPPQPSESRTVEAEWASNPQPFTQDEPRPTSEASSH